MEFWQQLALVTLGGVIAFWPIYLVERCRRRHDQADRLRVLCVRFAAEVTRTKFETLMLRGRVLSSRAAGESTVPPDPLDMPEGAVRDTAIGIDELRDQISYTLEEIKITGTPHMGQLAEDVLHKLSALDGVARGSPEDETRWNEREQAFSTAMRQFRDEARRVA